MEMESFAGSAEMTLFWHCIFPGDISSKPRRREIYACGDCGEDCDGFRGVVLWLGDPEHPHTSLCSICHSALTTSPFLRVSPRSLSLPESRTVRRARMHQREPPWRGCTTLKSIHVKQTKEQSESKITMKSCDILFFVSLYMQIYFSSLGSILSLQTSGRWIVPSAARRSEFHFANLATLSFSHAKQHKFLSPPDPWIVNPSSVPRSRMLHGDLCKKKTFNKKKRKEQWNDKPLRDCGRLSRHEWARVTLPQAVSPSISGSVTSSQPAPLDVFFPAADERRWQEAWNALDLFIARRTAICLGTDAPLNSEMVG